MIPAVGDMSAQRASLRQTVGRSATIQKLLGVSTVDDALTHVFDDFGEDDASAPDEFPRVVLFLDGRQQLVWMGGEGWLAKSQYAAFIQYEKFTDDQLTAWYGSGSVSLPFTVHDHRQHLINLYGLIAAELRAVRSEAGCLEFQKLIPMQATQADETTENGKVLFQLAYQFESEGLP